MISRHWEAHSATLVPVRQDLRATTPPPANRRRYYLLRIGFVDQRLSFRGNDQRGRDGSDYE